MFWDAGLTTASLTSWRDCCTDSLFSSAEEPKHKRAGGSIKESVIIKTAIVPSIAPVAVADIPRTGSTTEGQFNTTNNDITREETDSNAAISGRLV